MSRDGAIIGISDHNGWAVLVTVAGDGTLLDRRRVELVDADLPSMPHQHEGQDLPLEQAEDLVGRVRVSADRHAKLSLEAVKREVSAPIQGMALRARPRLPATIAERIRSYWAQSRADSVMYRTALAGAAQSRGWFVCWYDAKEVLDTAREHVHDLDARFVEIRQSIGPPWQKDHKIAMAAAIVASKRETPACGGHAEP